MSVVIPGEIGLAAPRTGFARAASTGPVGDYGLREAGDLLKRAAEQHGQVADIQAQAAFSQAQTAFDTGYIPAAKAYGAGEAPRAGFAEAQLAARDRIFSDGGQGLSTAARQRYDQLSVQHRVQAADHALSTEATGLQHWAEVQRTAAATATGASLLSDNAVATHDELNAAQHADATAPDFASARLTAFDGRVADHLAKVPEIDRPALQQQFASQRSNYQLQLAAMRTHQAEATTQLKTGEAFDTLRNGVANDPSFLDTAVRTAPAALSALPTEQRDRALSEAPGALYSAAVKGRLDAQDFDGAAKVLDRPDAQKTIPPAFYAQARAAITSFNTSRTRALQGAELGPALEAEIASVQATGISTGFDPVSVEKAYGPVEGPAKAVEAQRAIGQARQVYALTGGNFQALAPVDQDARLAAAKPAPGDKDFATKQAVYDAALKQRDEQRQQLVADPARGVTADRTLGEAWRQAQTGDPTKMQAWAGATLSRQAAIGVAPADRRILPTAEAKRLAHEVDAAGSQRAQALTRVASYAAAYGSDGPRVLGELALNGLDRTDVTLLVEAGDDPIAVGQFARGRERGAALKLQPGQDRQLGDGVTEALRPLAATFAANPGGPAHADAVHDVVMTAAKGFMADGVAPADAARKAAAPYLGRYYLSPAGWRMPTTLSEQPATATVSAVGEDVARYQARSGGAALVRPQQVPTRQAVTLGAGRAVRDLTADGGAALLARGTETGLTDAQKRARYADVVADRARWVTLPDNGGLQLVIPSPAGDFAPVFDKQGRAVERRWGALLDRAAAKP